MCSLPYTGKTQGDTQSSSTHSTPNAPHTNTQVTPIVTHTKTLQSNVAQKRNGQTTGVDNDAQKSTSKDHRDDNHVAKKKKTTTNESSIKTL